LQAREAAPEGEHESLDGRGRGAGVIARLQVRKLGAEIAFRVGIVIACVG